MDNDNAIMLDDYPTFSLETDYNVLPECKYIDFSDIVNVLSVNSFNIIIFNIRSCRKNFNEFACQFAEQFHKYDVIVLMETWLTSPFSNLFTINGFKHLDSFRSNDGGGLRVYFRNVLNVQLMAELTLISGNYEMLSL